MQQPPGIEADGDPLASSTADVPLDASSAATAGPVDIPGLSKGTRDEIRWSRRSKDAVWQRPVTAGQVRLPIGLQEQHHAAQQSRPQTAVAARQEWPVSRLGLELQGHMPWMQEGIQGSVERPSSPVRERMKHAVERESCLRLEAEMAALDVGELLHQKAAAEGAAQAEAAKNAELQQQMAQVKEELHAARRDASRQHARELQLDLTQAHMANAALRLQLDEAQMEVTAEHERSKAAESALEAQRRERRAAEYVCSRPASPHRDAALHAELANLRLQVAELTGRLQHAEQTHTDLLTQIRSSSALQKTLADLAESLTMDVTKLKGLLDCSEADGTMSKVANWGFPKHEAGDSPGPSRPVTATPCDNMQRPNRQWSAGPTRHEAYRQQAGDAGQQRQSRPMTATIHGRFAHDAVGMSLVDAAGRRSGVVPNRRSGQGKQADMWIDPVPPTRMPEEILQQAREDYMKEKKRVRDKRLQELAAKAGDMTNAASQ
ncbi:hypothetical protein WJX79_002245 [Trebouxia sp. C0005]